MTTQESVFQNWGLLCSTIRSLWSIGFDYYWVSGYYRSVIEPKHVLLLSWTVSSSSEPSMRVVTSSCCDLCPFRLLDVGVRKPENGGAPITAPHPGAASISWKRHDVKHKYRVMLARCMVSVQGGLQYIDKNSLSHKILSHCLTISNNIHIPKYMETM